jgi:folate-dependent phosphoribosylglycinamide formyltransferase PurN
VLDETPMNTGKVQLRVVVFTGGAVLEHDCLRFIARVDVEPGLQLVGVFCETDSPGVSGVIRDLWTRRRWLAPLLLAQRGLRRAARIMTSPRAEMARRRTLRRISERVHFVADLHATPVLSRVVALRPDLGAVYGGPILRPELFRIPLAGTLGIHHGRLPHYRGKKTTFWAMHNGEESVGVAIQRIGSGLDRGDILRDAVLRTGRTPLPVMSRRLESLGLDLYIEALRSVHAGTAVFRPQAAAGGRLYRDPRPADIARYWFKYLAMLLKYHGAPRGSDV